MTSLNQLISIKILPEAVGFFTIFLTFDARKNTFNFNGQSEYVTKMCSCLHLIFALHLLRTFLNCWKKFAYDILSKQQIYWSTLYLPLLSFCFFFFTSFHLIWCKKILFWVSLDIFCGNRSKYDHILLTIYIFHCRRSTHKKITWILLKLTISSWSTQFTKHGQLSFLCWFQ